jgi:hypothetical protein
MRKQRDARIVKFHQDYNPGGKRDPIYEKGSTHAIHVDTVNKLKKQGVKLTDEKVDWNALHEKIKASRKVKAAA